MTSAHPLRGILLFITGLLLFACMDAMVKLLTASYPVPMIAALRYFVHLMLMVALLGPRHGRTLLKTTRTGWVIARAVSLAGATLFIALALKRMPVAEMTAIVFLSPLLVVLIAGPLLGEEVSAADWIAAAVGFAGIVLIARPGGDGGIDPVGLACALGGVVVMTVYQLLSRTLAATESTLALLFWTAMTGSTIFGLLLPWTWEGGLPPWRDGLLFVAVGATGGLGHFLFTAAYRQASASALAPLMYVQLLWAGLLGWLVFDHVPHGWSIVGMAMVAGCGIVAGLRSHRVRRKAIATSDLEA